MLMITKQRNQISPKLLIQQMNMAFAVLFLFYIFGGIAASGSNLENFKCGVRYELAAALKREGVCTQWTELHPLCKRNIVVAYSEAAPYVHSKDGEVHGVIPDMLRSIMSTCCLGCNKLKFVGPATYLTKFHNKNASIVMPIETSKSSTQFFSREFIYFLEVPAVSFLLKPQRHSASELTADLFKSVLSTWPLFITALLMAIIAGIAIWMMDTWFNVLEFPRSFLRGPFEGFWWAFVSMTTVGYGDRAPKSYIARIFAVIWIFLGVTIFSMYSAALTSALTKKVVVTRDSLSGKKIAVVNTTAASHAAARRENAEIKGYGGIDEIIRALKKGEADGAAFDDNVANFFSAKIKKALPDFEFRHRVAMSGTAYGITIKDVGLPKGSMKYFFKTFFDNNEDQREAIIAQAMAGVKKIESKQTEETTSVFSHESPIFIVTLFCLLGIGGCLFVGGLFIQFIVFRKKKRAPKPKDERYLIEMPKTTKGFDFCNGKEDKDNAMTMDEVEAAFVDDVKQVCRKWRKRIESKANHKPCGEAKQEKGKTKEFLQRL
ncbi:uncharacterized protein LOC135692560 isoform X2 [Rhopilema esculentum]|uniref:uncharacterized protein LOC135692560 isoform X2 n=1 Tax=Rhopilema esculentum TaxID=499914 RepID=UPI0031D3A6B8